MFFRRIGIDVETAPSHRTFCRPCLDWSERRYHLAGVLGDRIMHFCFDEGWIKQKPKNRVVDDHAARRAQIPRAVRAAA